MKHFFRMYGRIVQVLRFEVSYTLERAKRIHTDKAVLSPTTEVTREAMIEQFPTREEAESFALKRNGTITELDSSAYEWMDGIEVADVPDTFAEAIRIYEMGQEAYEAELNADPEADRDELLFDLAYRLALLEMGVTM